MFAKMKIIILTILMIATIASCARYNAAKKKYPTLAEFAGFDESFQLPVEEDIDTKAPNLFRGDLTKAKIVQLQSKNQGNGKFKYTLETQNGIEITQVGKLKDKNTLVVMGSYAYTGGDGRRYRVRYTADEFGYHPRTELDIDIPELSIADKISKPIKPFAPFKFDFKPPRVNSERNRNTLVVTQANGLRSELQGTGNGAGNRAGNGAGNGNSVNNRKATVTGAPTQGYLPPLGYLPPVGSQQRPTEFLSSANGILPPRF